MFEYFKSMVNILSKCSFKIWKLIGDAKPHKNNVFKVDMARKSHKITAVFLWISLLEHKFIFNKTKSQIAHIFEDVETEN